MADRELALAAIGVCAAFFASACTSVEANTPTIFVEGCREVTSSGECRILGTTTSTLTVWIEAPAPIDVRIDGASRRIDTTTVRGGERFKLFLSAPARISVASKNGERRIRITTALVPEVLLRAERMRKGGDFQGARALLEPMRNEADIAVRAKVVGQLARIALATGDHRTAISELHESIRMNRSAGAVWSEMDDRYALAFIEKNEGDYAGARDVLAGVRELEAAHPSGARWAAYYEGYAALGTSDLRRALSHFERAMIHAERVELTDIFTNAAQLEVQTLHRLGRNEEARELLATIEARIPLSPICARTEALELTGMLRIELGGSDPGAEGERAKTTALLTEAATGYERACAKPRRLAFSRALLGAALLEGGRIDEADAMLAASKAAFAEPGVPLRLSQLELEADIALARRDRPAEEKFRRLEVYGLLLDNPLVRWRGALGRGRALEQNGHFDTAIDAYREAEDLLEQLRFNAPLGGGRETFLGDRVESASRYIELLVRANRIDDAVRAARRSRARALSSLAWTARIEDAPEDARREWYSAVSKYQEQRAAYERDTIAEWGIASEKIAAYRDEREKARTSARALLDEALVSLGASSNTELASLALDAHELALIYHPLREGWIGFAIDASGSIAHRFADPSKDDLLAPFAERIRANEMVRILPYGALNAIDFHALPFEGRPLIAAIAVRYGVDVGDARVAPQRNSALVVAPFAELKSAQRESTIAEERLASLGWRVQRMLGNAATRGAINEAIAVGDATLFQYSGHASFAGLDGWDSHLGDAEHELLTVGDILALRAAPSYVILSGCETAATAATAGRGVSGLGLAQAFVVAGARWVVASTRPIKDTDATAIIGELYAEQGKRPDANVASLLRAAQQRVLEKTPAIDWASVRVLVP